MKLHTKYQRHVPSGFRQEDFFKFSVKESIFSSCDLDVQWTGTILNNFERGPTKDHSWKEISFEENVYGRTDRRTHRRTHDGRRTKCDPKSSPCHYVTGELKIVV